MTNPLGAVWSMSYDLNGRLISATDPLGNVTQLWLRRSSETGSSTTNPLGATDSAVYDGANKLIARVDALGNRTSFVYDAASNRTA